MKRNTLSVCKQAKDTIHWRVLDTVGGPLLSQTSGEYHITPGGETDGSLRISSLHRAELMGQGRSSGASENHMLKLDPESHALALVSVKYAMTFRSNFTMLWLSHPGSLAQCPPGTGALSSKG